MDLSYIADQLSNFKTAVLALKELTGVAEALGKLKDLPGLVTELSSAAK
ncbi:hypothetical protein PAB09_11265 [Corynebacterium sp. SCR221107]|nr:hypothetical protein [Corynebacterium sp. SCR221107]WBT08435.1 hypothetical protein PAB09_11265 [Corynebacterium sp. SCR221107]